MGTPNISVMLSCFLDVLNVINEDIRQRIVMYCFFETRMIMDKGCVWFARGIALVVVRRLYEILIDCTGRLINNKR